MELTCIDSPSAASTSPGATSITVRLLAMPAFSTLAVVLDLPASIGTVSLTFTLTFALALALVLVVGWWGGILLVVVLSIFGHPGVLGLFGVFGVDSFHLLIIELVLGVLTLALVFGVNDSHLLVVELVLLSLVLVLVLGGVDGTLLILCWSHFLVVLVLSGWLHVRVLLIFRR